MATKILAQEELHKDLNYDPNTGLFTKKNLAVGHYNPSGYLMVRACGVYMAAHRLAWIYCHGDIGDGLVIDHINGKRHDNRIANLRPVTVWQNAQNVGIRHTASRLQKLLLKQQTDPNKNDWHMKRFCKYL